MPDGPLPPKRIPVRFGEGLPLGTHATFTHNGQRWIAYPQPKMIRVLTVIDKMIGIHDTLARRLLQWINTTPADTDRVIVLLDDVRRARTQLAQEKIRGQTQ